MPSRNFLLSFGLLVLSFFTMQGIVVPSIVRKENLAQVSTARQGTKVENIYNLKPSEKFPGAFTFDYQFDKVPTFKDGVAFDVPIQQFDQSKAGEVADISPVHDAWGYPVRENAYMGIPKEKIVAKELPGKESGGGAKNLDPGSEVGVYNCRANTGVTGYFKAYFEDVALDTNAGYDDQNFGAVRRAEACQVLQDISEMLMLDQTIVTPDIIFMVNPGNLPPSALAAASAYFGYYSVGPDNGSLHKHIISGQDPTPGTGVFDALITTNFNGVSWDVDSTLNSNTYDLYTVLYHEILHALGLRSLLPAVIPQTNVSHVYGTFDYYTHKDLVLNDPFINQITKLLNVPVGAPSPWFTTNEVVYRGKKNVVNVTPDGTLPVYSPTSWQQGSSLSHFDMNRASGQTYVMHPSIGTNTERNIHEDEKEVLCHLGYMINNMPGCEDPTPVAVDDMIIIEPGTPTCGKPISNDYPFFGGVPFGAFLIKDMNSTTVYPGDSIAFRTGPDCQSPTLPTPPAKTFLFNPGLGSSPDYRAFEYSNFNAASPTARISFPAKIILLPSCDWVLNDPYEYVCNGDFELGPTSIIPIHYGPGLGYGNHAFNYNSVSAVPYWASKNTADLATKNNSNYPFGPLNLPYGISDMLGQSHYAARMLVNHSDPQSYSYCEPIGTELREPLASGQQYTLKFDIHGVLHQPVNTNQQYYSDVTPFFSNINFLATTSLNACSLYDDSNITQALPSSPVIPLDTSDWTSVEYNFTADGNYSFLTLSPRRVESFYDYFSSRSIYIDNISIRPVNAPPPPLNPPTPTYSGQITGTLYQDLNQNGSQQVAIESGLSGIQVGLFQVGNNAPIQTAITQDIPNLGKYSFNNLPDGTYYVALVGENLYPSITQPDISSDPFPSINHMYNVDVLNGQTVTDRNFGITLNVGPILGCTDPKAENYNPLATEDDGSCIFVDPLDIKIEKSLIDSTLSLFDRFITWRIVVRNQNLWAENATDILVKEVIPPGLIYHSNFTPAPNTYDTTTNMLHIPSLAGGAQTYIDITMKVPISAKICGPKTNMAVLHALDQVDTNANNNQGNATINLQKCKTQAPTQLDPG